MSWRERLPHRPPACLVAGLAADGVLLDAARGLDRWQLLEGCAQAAAVAGGGHGSGGLLASVSRVRFLRAAEPGERVVVQVADGLALGALRQVRIRIDGIIEGELAIAAAPAPPSAPWADRPHAFEPTAAARAFDGAFAADLPVFAGHFPGRPLVPGVYLLALLERIAGIRADGIGRAVFQRPALPGERLAPEPGRIAGVCRAAFVTNGRTDGPAPGG